MLNGGAEPFIVIRIKLVRRQLYSQQGYLQQGYLQQGYLQQKLSQQRLSATKVICSKDYRSEEYPQQGNFRRQHSAARYIVCGKALSVIYIVRGRRRVAARRG